MNIRIVTEPVIPARLRGALPQSNHFRRTLKSLLLVLAGAALASAQAATNAAPGTPVHLDEFLRRVWERNEAIQIRVLEAAISDERHKAEKGVLEPEFVFGFDAVDKRRPNTQEQIFNLFGATLYNERNRTYQGAFESTVATGARLRAGYSLQSLNNNLNDARFGNGEWLTTVGLTATQPLLRGFGPKVTLAGIRAAAINSEISFQDYRKGLAEVMSKAEASYWALYQAQEEAAIARESLRLAETILRDNRKRFELGKAPELDVLQAEAGLALRQATEIEGRQRLQEAQSRIAAMVSESPDAPGAILTAADVPKLGAQPMKLSDLWVQAYECNPEIISQLKQADLDGVRLVVARNQRLPQLDLKGGYGFTGLGGGPGGSWDKASQQDFPSWSIGLELHIPLGGGVKSRHELKATQLRREATLLALENIQNQLANGLRAMIQSVLTLQDNAPRYQKAVDFNQDVLKNQLARLEAGKTDSRAVLQAEEDLFKARVSALDNLVKYQRAGLDLETLAGTLLKNRNLDLTREDLRNRSTVLTKSGKISREKYDEFLQEMKQEYEKRRGSPPVAKAP